MRNGSQPPSKKTIRLVEQAEHAAGLVQPLDKSPAQSSNDWKTGPPKVPTPGMVREERKWYGSVTPKALRDVLENVKGRERELSKAIEELETLVNAVNEKLKGDES